MAKKQITKEKAREMLSKKLDKVDFQQMRDIIYTAAIDFVDSIAADINSKYDVLGENDGEESWFDEEREDFTKSVFENLNK